MNGGGVYKIGGTVRNCIVFGNTRAGVAQDLYGTSGVVYSCAPELAAGTNGNGSSDPLFRDPGSGVYTLKAGSPCVNAGSNAAWMTSGSDLAGKPRIIQGLVDMGAYEMETRSGVMFSIR